MASRKCPVCLSCAAWFYALCIHLLLVDSEHHVSGQGTGPLGSIADYYDHAFGNPFLGYWKNPGNKNPYGSQQAPYGGYGNYAGIGSPLGGGGGVTGYGSGLGGGGLYANGLAGFDRAPIASPSYAYDRIVPGNADYNYPNSLLSYGGGNALAQPYVSDALLGSAALGRGALYGGTVAGLPNVVGGSYAGLGYNYPIVDSRTPADRALQNLLVSTYAYKPWYP